VFLCSHEIEYIHKLAVITAHLIHILIQEIHSVVQFILFEGVHGSKQSKTFFKLLLSLIQSSIISSVLFRNQNLPLFK